ncbi:ABC transporter ATP-binding protein [Algisphaera agarilytica]|uniref:Putative ABC transport system ATP-binding protein n=1 Tax=Algisphaera agarilytica TaxID=1385975 RepID=A0A7X0LIS3_9BACT|nr:ABC transporter ATP-binding protein [Algisphaera agarilytica]MBB6428535.1 putative ABC transport system ATP-binding protein [Algisphaera agarilytica]
MSEAVAEIQQVTKVYQKSKLAPPVHALAGVDLVIPRGQYIAIMGPSGSGKSTMMNIIGCLDRPTSGKYLLDGEDVATMSDERLSKVRGKRLGFVFQAFNLIPQLSVQENVAVPLFYQGISPARRRELAAVALDKVQLAERMDHRPSELSGGQQQRVAIARALVNEPSILLADEPTGALDTKTGDAILEIFEELHNNGQTVVVITHDEEVAHHCERVVRLRDGLIDRDEAGGKSAAVAAQAT